MKLGIFVSDFTITVDTLERVKAEKLGLILVENGVYHATVKTQGKASALLDKTNNLYVLSEDLQTRGIQDSEVNPKVKIVSYGDIVNLMFNEYEKLAWL